MVIHRAAIWALAGLCLARPAAAQGPDYTSAPGTETLVSGPVHEAFASPLIYDPRPTAVVAKQPPPPIDEVPPDQKPVGANIQWIPGYWGWDDSRNDFVWISGLWREPPPGRQWVPGYWTPAQNGFQWVPGAWVPLGQDAADPNAGAQYLPTPPDSLEAGPNVAAPGADFAWSPGYWQWMGDRYAWRPGFWVQTQPNWSWSPAHYNWTPNGSLFVDGYWDRPVQTRGTLFAPVYFQQPVYRQQGYSYTPGLSILAGSLLSNLFVRPSYGQYYFGDYYSQSNFQQGYYPSYSFHQSRYGYDPIYAYGAARNGGNPGWSNGLRDDYLYRRDHAEARPPHTFVQQQSLAQQFSTVNNVNNVNNINNINNVTRNNFLMARSIDNIARGPDQGVRYEAVAADRRQEYARQSRAVNQFREQRFRQEGEAARARPASAPITPSRFDLPRSPIAHQAQTQAQPVAPPQRPNVPAPRPELRPRPAEAPHPRPEPHPESRQFGPGHPGFTPQGEPHRQPPNMRPAALNQPPDAQAQQRQLAMEQQRTQQAQARQQMQAQAQQQAAARQQALAQQQAAARQQASTQQQAQAAARQQALAQQQAQVQARQQALAQQQAQAQARQQALAQQQAQAQQQAVARQQAQALAQQQAQAKQQAAVAEARQRAQQKGQNQPK